jgi:hypothetical protein
MNIGLIDVDSHGFPNLALMKLSAWHKLQGDIVEWYNPFDHYDKVYMAKVFNFTEDYRQWITNTLKGGRFLPHCQPYRDLNNPHQIIPQWQKDLAGWTNKKWVFRSCEFKDFEPRKGFKCEEYFTT